MKATAPTKPRIKRNQVPCRVTGCDKGPFKNAQAELMHYHRVHSGKILVGHQRFRTAVPESNGHHEKINLGRGRMPVLAAPPRPAVLPHKRKYHKRRKLLRGTTTAEVEIGYCPSCLTCLHSVAVGMVMAKAKTKVNGCPKCGLDIRILAAGMAMDRPGKE